MMNKRVKFVLLLAVFMTNVIPAKVYSLEESTPVELTEISDDQFDEPNAMEQPEQPEPPEPPEQPEPPTKPANIKVIKRQATSLTVQFSRVKDCTGYEIFLNDKSVGKTTKTTYTLSRLKPAVRNKIGVRSYIDNKDGDLYSDTKSVTAWTIPATPSFSVQGQTEKFTVKWKQVAGATHYRVYYKPDKKGNWKLLAKVNPKRTSYTSKACGGRSYSVMVKAVRTVSKKEIYQSAGTAKNVTVKRNYRLYQVKSNTSTYYSNKKRANQTVSYGNWYAGYYDYRYGKNWRVIYINNTTRLVPVKYLSTRKNAHIMPSSSISQYSGKINGVGACGVSSIVSLVNTEKGTQWNKDNLTAWVNRKKYLVDYPLNDWRTHGMDDKGIMRTVKEYSNEKYTIKNIYNYNVTSTILTQLKKGKRCLVNIHCYGYINHLVTVTGYEYINGNLHFYYTDSAYTGYNLPLRRMDANTMQYLARNVDQTFGNSRYIFVLN